jgi:glycosyltransferase involved in cell wall biosynthesis
LDSALAQTWSNKEIIVIENGSSDDTRTIAEAYRGYGVTTESISARSAAAARNRAFALSRGEFIQFLDADDLLSPNKIAAQMAAISRGAAVLALSSLADFRDGDSPESARVWSEWPYVSSTNPSAWLGELMGARDRGGFVGVHQWLTPRALVADAGPWNEELTVNDDGEFFARVVLRACEIRMVPEAVAYYRRHQSAANLSAAFQHSRRHLESMLHATELIAGHLQRVNSDPRLRPAFARHYFDCALAAYPFHPDISQRAESLALSQHAEARPPRAGSRAAEVVRRLCGWRFERRLSAWWHQQHRSP